MRSETITRREIGAPKIVTPRRGAAKTVGYVTKKLLVPADRAKKLRCEFVFRLEVIGERIGIAEPGNFKTRLEKFRPQLPVMPGEADVLAEHALMIIVDAGSIRQRGH